MQKVKEKFISLAEDVPKATEVILSLSKEGYINKPFSSSLQFKYEQQERQVPPPEEEGGILRNARNWLFGAPPPQEQPPQPPQFETVVVVDEDQEENAIYSLIDFNEIESLIISKNLIQHIQNLFGALELYLCRLVQHKKIIPLPDKLEEKRIKNIKREWSVIKKSLNILLYNIEYQALEAKREEKYMSFLIFLIMAAYVNSFIDLINYKLSPSTANDNIKDRIPLEIQPEDNNITIVVRFLKTVMRALQVRNNEMSLFLNNFHLPMLKLIYTHEDKQMILDENNEGSLYYYLPERFDEMHFKRKLKENTILLTNDTSQQVANFKKIINSIRPDNDQDSLEKIEAMLWSKTPGSTANNLLVSSMITDYINNTDSIWDFDDDNVNDDDDENLFDDIDYFYDHIASPINTYTRLKKKKQKSKLYPYKLVYTSNYNYWIPRELIFMVKLAAGKNVLCRILNLDKKRIFLKNILKEQNINVKKIIMKYMLHLLSILRHGGSNAITFLKEELKLSERSIETLESDFSTIEKILNDADTNAILISNLLKRILDEHDYFDIHNDIFEENLVNVQNYNALIERLNDSPWRDDITFEEELTCYRFLGDYSKIMASIAYKFIQASTTITQSNQRLFSIRLEERENIKKILDSMIVILSDFTKQLIDRSKLVFTLPLTLMSFGKYLEITSTDLCRYCTENLDLYNMTSIQEKPQEESGVIPGSREADFKPRELSIFSHFSPRNQCLMGSLLKAKRVNEIPNIANFSGNTILSHYMEKSWIKNFTYDPSYFINLSEGLSVMNQFIDKKDSEYQTQILGYIHKYAYNYIHQSTNLNIDMEKVEKLTPWSFRKKKFDNGFIFSEKKDQNLIDVMIENTFNNTKSQLELMQKNLHDLCSIGYEMAILIFKYDNDIGKRELAKQLIVNIRKIPNFIVDDYDYDEYEDENSPFIKRKRLKSYLSLFSDDKKKISTRAITEVYLSDLINRIDSLETHLASHNLIMGKNYKDYMRYLRRSIDYEVTNTTYFPCLYTLKFLLQIKASNIDQRCNVLIEKFLALLGDRRCMNTYLISPFDDENTIISTLGKNLIQVPKLIKGRLLLHEGPKSFWGKKCRKFISKMDTITDIVKRERNHPAVHPADNNFIINSQINPNKFLRRFLQGTDQIYNTTCVPISSSSSGSSSSSSNSSSSGGENDDNAENQKIKTNIESYNILFDHLYNGINNIADNRKEPRLDNLINHSIVCKSDGEKIMDIVSPNRVRWGKENPLSFYGDIIDYHFCYDQEPISYLNFLVLGAYNYNISYTPNMKKRMENLLQRKETLFEILKDIQVEIEQGEGRKVPPFNILLKARLRFTESICDMISPTAFVNTVKNVSGIISCLLLAKILNYEGRKFTEDDKINAVKYFCGSDTELTSLVLNKGKIISSPPIFDYEDNEIINNIKRRVTNISKEPPSIPFSGAIDLSSEHSLPDNYMLNNPYQRVNERVENFLANHRNLINERLIPLIDPEHPITNNIIPNPSFILDSTKYNIIIDLKELNKMREADPLKERIEYGKICKKIYDESTRSTNIFKTIPEIVNKENFLTYLSIIRTNFTGLQTLKYVENELSNRLSKIKKYANFYTGDHRILKFIWKENNTGGSWEEWWNKLRNQNFSQLEGSIKDVISYIEYIKQNLDKCYKNLLNHLQLDENIKLLKEILSENTIQRALQCGLDGTTFSVNFSQKYPETLIENLNKFVNDITYRNDISSRSTNKSPLFLSSLLASEPYSREENRSIDSPLNLFQFKVENVEFSTGSSLMDLKSLFCFINHNCRNLLDNISKNEGEEEEKEEDEEKKGDSEQGNQMDTSVYLDTRLLDEQVQTINNHINKIKNINCSSDSFLEEFNIIIVDIGMLMNELERIIVSIPEPYNLPRDILTDYIRLFEKFEENKTSLVQKIHELHERTIKEYTETASKKIKENNTNINKEYTKKREELDERKREILKLIENKKTDLIKITDNSSQDIIKINKEIERLEEEEKNIEDTYLEYEKEKEKAERETQSVIVNITDSYIQKSREELGTYVKVIKNKMFIPKKDILNIYEMIRDIEENKMLKKQRKISSCFLEPMHYLYPEISKNMASPSKIISGLCDGCVSKVFGLETQVQKTKNEFDFTDVVGLKEPGEFLRSLIQHCKLDSNSSELLLNQVPNSRITHLTFDMKQTVLVYKPHLKMIKQGTILLPTSELLHCRGQEFLEFRKLITKSFDTNTYNNVNQLNTLTASLARLEPNRDYLFFTCKDENSSFASIRDDILMLRKTNEEQIVDITQKRRLGEIVRKREEKRSNYSQLNTDVALICYPNCTLNSHLTSTFIDQQLSNINKKLFRNQNMRIEETASTFSHSIQRALNSLTGGNTNVNPIVVGIIQNETIKAIKKYLGLADYSKETTHLKQFKMWDSKPYSIMEKIAKRSFNTMRFNLENITPQYQLTKYLEKTAQKRKDEEDEGRAPLGIFVGGAINTLMIDSLSSSSTAREENPFSSLNLNLEKVKNHIDDLGRRYLTNYSEQEPNLKKFLSHFSNTDALASYCKTGYGSLLDNFLLSIKEVFYCPNDENNLSLFSLFRRMNSNSSEISNYSRLKTDVINRLTKISFLCQYMFAHKIEEISGQTFPRNISQLVREKLGSSDRMSVFEKSNDFLCLSHALIVEDHYKEIARDRLLGTQYLVKQLKCCTNIPKDIPHVLTNFLLLSQGIVNRDCKIQTNSALCDSLLISVSDKQSLTKNIGRFEKIYGKPHDILRLISGRVKCSCPFVYHHEEREAAISTRTRIITDKDIREYGAYTTQKIIAFHDFLRVTSMLDKEMSAMSIKKYMTTLLNCGYGRSYIKCFLPQRETLDSLLYSPAGVNLSSIVTEHEPLTSLTCFHHSFCASDYKATVATVLNMRGMDAPTNSLEPSSVILRGCLNPNLLKTCNEIYSEFLRLQNKIMTDLQEEMKESEFIDILGEDALKKMTSMNENLKSIIEQYHTESDSFVEKMSTVKGQDYIHHLTKPKGTLDELIENADDFHLGARINSDDNSQLKNLVKNVFALVKDNVDEETLQKIMKNMSENAMVTEEEEEEVEEEEEEDPFTGEYGNITAKQVNNFSSKFTVFVNILENSIIPFFNKRKGEIKQIIHYGNAITHLEIFLKFGLSNSRSFDLSHLGARKKMTIDDSCIFRILHPLIIFVFNQAVTAIILREIEFRNYLIEKHKSLAEFIAHPDTTMITENAEYIIGKGGSGNLGLPLSTLIQSLGALYSINLNGDHHLLSSLLPNEELNGKSAVHSNKTPILTIPKQTKLLVSMPTMASGLVVNSQLQKKLEKEKVYLWSDAIVPTLLNLSHTDATVHRMSIKVEKSPLFTSFENSLDINTSSRREGVYCNDKEIILDNLIRKDNDLNGLACLINALSPATTFLNAVTTSSTHKNSMFRSFISDSQDTLGELEKKIKLVTDDRDHKSLVLVKKMKQEVERINECYIQYQKWNHNITRYTFRPLAPSSTSIESLYNPANNLFSTFFLYPFSNSLTSDNESTRFNFPLRDSFHFSKESPHRDSNERKKFIEKLTDIFGDNNSNMRTFPGIFDYLLDIENSKTLKKISSIVPDRNNSTVLNIRNNNNSAQDIITLNSIYN